MLNIATLYIGTYAVRGSGGIYQVEIELASGVMRIVSTAAASDASYLALSPDGRMVYAVEESISQDGSGPSVAAYFIEKSGALTRRDHLPIPGVSPCHVAVAPGGRWLITSNYSDGTNTVVALRSGDGQDAGSLSHVVQHSANQGEVGPHERQEAPHAHFAQFLKLETGALRLYSCDLGLDSVVVFDFDPVSGRLAARPDDGIALPPSAGPRHLAFHPRPPMAYVFGELDSTIYAYRMTPSHGEQHGVLLDLMQAAPSLPIGYVDKNWGAAIKISPDGGVVTVSNRGRDTLASFSIDAESGLLLPLGETPCGGEWPRDFAYVGSELLVVANERSDDLTAFRINPSGMPVRIELPEAQLALPSPACVVARLHYEPA